MNETNQNHSVQPRPPNQAIIEASRYAAELYPDADQQGTAVQYFLSQPWTATRNDTETFQRVHSTIDTWVALPEHERVRWSWVTPRQPVPVCQVSLSKQVEWLRVRGAYGKTD